jgi:hypothetical protein
VPFYNFLEIHKGIKMDREKLEAEAIEMIKRLDNWTLTKTHEALKKREADMKAAHEQINNLINRVSQGMKEN